MSSTTTTDTYAQAPKFSRYRSVRKAAAAVIPEPTPAVPESKTVQLTRTPSRYHRATHSQTQTVPLPAQPVPLPPPDSRLPQRSPTTTYKVPSKPTSQGLTAQTSPRPRIQPRDNGDHKFTSGPVQIHGQYNTASPVAEHTLSRAASNATRSSAFAPAKAFEAAREEARMILEGEYDRMQMIKKMQTKSELAGHDETSDLKRRPTQIQRPKSPPCYVDAPKLSVKRKIQRSLPEKYHDAPKLTRPQPQPQSPERPSRSSKPQEIKRESSTEKPPNTNVPNSPTTAQKQQEAPQFEASRFDAPKFDAPISAVNAGDRRVMVKLENAATSISLPVTPTTNARDLLNSASVVMSENINPRTAVMVESFCQLGLERPLRRYEHIRDVMNSWDRDNQNYLTIMSDSECETTGLESSEVPDDAPARVMVQMHLSTRPGKWEKRWVTLRSDGQVTMSKHENDSDGTNICHLSDFDVYTLTAGQRKKLKPPKKICFAVKSQQKSAMFLEGVNFVHFFSTSDKQTADRWYAAVQKWRSWYLMHVLGEGAPKPKANCLVSGVADASETRPSTAESVPYQLGSFKPLLDFSDLKFDTSFDDVDTDAKPKNSGSPQKPLIELATNRTSIDVGISEATRRGSRQRGVPPSSFPTKSFPELENKRLAGLDNSDQGFTGGGLLARSASVKRSQGGKISGQGLPGFPGRPLVDLAPASNFIEGSLLGKLEAWSMTQGENEPRIDRQRRVEANVKTGEGLR